MADFADTTTGYVFELQTGVAGPAFEPFAAAVGGYKNILAKISDATSLDPESIEGKAAFLSVAHTPVFDDGSSGIELTAGAGVMIIRTLLDVQTKDSEVVVCSFSGQSAPQKLATFALPTGEGTLFVATVLNNTGIVIALERAYFRNAALEANLPSMQAALASEFSQGKASSTYALGRVTTSGPCQ